MLLVYGRVPLFYFIVHLYLIHGILLVVLLLQGFRPVDLRFGPFQFGHSCRVGGGLGIAGVYAIWVGGSHRPLSALPLVWAI